LSRNFRINAEVGASFDKLRMNGREDKGREEDEEEYLCMLH